MTSNLRSLGSELINNFYKLMKIETLNCLFIISNEIILQINYNNIISLLNFEAILYAFSFIAKKYIKLNKLNENSINNSNNNKNEISINKNNETKSQHFTKY